MNGTTANTSPDRRRRDIQGLRGVAVVLVVLYHSGFAVPGGFIGVDVFFVVSGYVITQMLLRELRETGSIDYGRFYRRRIRRLLPALAVMLLVVAVASIALLGPLGQQQRALQTGVAATVSVANLQLLNTPGGYFASAAESNPFLHTWTLSVEEQFYLFLPLFLAIGWRSARRRRNPHLLLAGVMLGVVFVSFFLGLNLSTAGDIARGPATAFYSPVTRVWEFGVGVLAALVMVRLPVVSLPARNILGAAGLVSIVLAAFAVGEVTPFPGWATLLPVVGAALIIYAGAHQQSGHVSRAVVAGPVVWIGDISYSWYLWHWPFIVFAQTVWPGSWVVAPAAAVLSLAPATWSYRVVEQPLRFGDRFPAAGGLAVGTACVAVSLTGLAFLGTANRILNEDPAVIAFATATRHHVDMSQDCVEPPQPVDASTASECTWPADSEVGSVYLIGDSNAGQFTEGLVAAAAAANYSLTATVWNACPFVDVELVHHGVHQTECSGLVDRTLAALLRDTPDLVVIASASDIYLNEDRWQLIDPISGQVLGDPESKARAWEIALEAVLTPLDQAGINTAVISPIPHFFTTHDRVLGDNCPSIRLLRDATECAGTGPRAELNAARQLGLAAEAAAIDSFPSVIRVDYFSQICPGDTCSMYQDGLWLYRDGTHLSVDGALSMSSVLGELLVAHQ